MATNGFSRAAWTFLCFAVAASLLGCEGISRKHDTRVIAENDIAPPGDLATPGYEGSVRLANFPDLVEQIIETKNGLETYRERFVDQLIELERAYLNAGDTVKANWARRQRESAENLILEDYPYLTAAPPEHRVEVAPEENIPEADELYENALSIYKEVRLVPGAGRLPANEEKARRALAMFKRVLKEYPTSDKVDDAAFFCGDIYKEIVRDEDPDNELSVRYYKWAIALDPATPHPARFLAAVVYDYRRHDRVRALELYHQVLETDERDESGTRSNARWAAARIDQLTNEADSPIRPVEPARDTSREPPAVATSGQDEGLPPTDNR